MSPIGFMQGRLRREAGDGLDECGQIDRVNIASLCRCALCVRPEPKIYAGSEFRLIVVIWNGHDNRNKLRINMLLLTSKRNVEEDNGISGLGIAVSHVGIWHIK